MSNEDMEYVRLHAMRQGELLGAEIMYREIQKIYPLTAPAKEFAEQTISAFKRNVAWEGTKPEMTKGQGYCPHCSNHDHLFLTQSMGHVCGKCFDKLEGFEP